MGVAKAELVWHWFLEPGYVIADTSGTIQVYFLKDDQPYAPCNGVEYYIFTYDGNNSPGDKSRDIMVSNLLSAHATGKKVGVILNCKDNTIHGVRLDKE